MKLTLQNICNSDYIVRLNDLLGSIMTMNEHPEINEFPKDGNYWRVDWFGALLPNPNITTEPFFQVIISPFIKNPFSISNNELAHNEIVNLNNQKIICVGIGQLPLITIGSIWLDGEIQMISSGKKERIENVIVSSDKIRIISAAHKENDKSIIPFRVYRLGHAGSGSKMVAIERNGDPFAILIPAMEILRFYYATSTNLSHAIFSGAFIHNLESIINTKNSTYIKEENLCILGLREHILDEEAWIMARLFLSKTAFQEMEKTYQSILKKSISKKTIHIESNFPFIGKTNLSARVKWIRESSNTPWRCLILSLYRCSGLFPYEKLMVIRDNDNRTVSGNSNIKDEERATYLRNSISNSTSVTGTPLQSGIDTNSNLSRIIISLPTQQFDALRGKTIQKIPKLECKYKRVAIPLKHIHVENLGTGLGGYSIDNYNTQKANILMTNVHKEDFSSSFDLLRKVVAELNYSKNIHAMIRDVNQSINFMPLTKPSHQKQWAYLDSSSRTRRDVIIADINIRDRFFNLIEFRMRNNENFTMALFSSGHRALSNKMLYEILFRCSLKSGIWKSIDTSDLQVNFIGLRHTWNDKLSCIESLKKKFNHLDGFI